MQKETDILKPNEEHTHSGMQCCKLNRKTQAFERLWQNICTNDKMVSVTKVSITGTIPDVHYFSDPYVVQH